MALDLLIIKALEGNQICPFLKVHPLMGWAGFSASSPLSGEDLEEEAEESDSTKNFTTVVPSAGVSLSERVLQITRSYRLMPKASCPKALQ